MSRKKCCVKNCISENMKLYRMPPHTEKVKLLKWLKASGNTELLKIPPKHLMNRYVCAIHFEERFVLQRCLSQTAVPTLHLPEPIDVCEYGAAIEKEEQVHEAEESQSMNGNQQLGSS